MTPVPCTPAAPHPVCTAHSNPERREGAAHVRQNKSAAVLARPWAPAAWPTPLGARAAPSRGWLSARAPSATPLARPTGCGASSAPSPLPPEGALFSLSGIAIGGGDMSHRTLSGPASGTGDPIPSTDARCSSPLSDPSPAAGSGDASSFTARHSGWHAPAAPFSMPLVTGLRFAAHSEMIQSILACIWTLTCRCCMASPWRSAAACSARAARSAISCRSPAAFLAVVPIRSSSAAIFIWRSAHAAISSFAVCRWASAASSDSANWSDSCSSFFLSPSPPVPRTSIPWSSV